MSVSSSSSSATGAQDIPDYNYPVPIIIKNTFLCTETWRPSSLDGFFEERCVKSCVSRLGAPGLPDAGEEGEEQFYDALETLPEREAEASMPLISDPPVDSVAAASAQGISFPTVGSIAHFDGSCKPCAFFHTKGCMQGPSCEFCHLCDASERKKRRKEKIAMMREQRAAATSGEASASW